jgi:hypothetical protein
MCTQCLTQADHGCALAFTERGGRDGGHVNVFAVLAPGKAVKDLEFDLGFVWPYISSSFSRMPSSAAICIIGLMWA